MRKYLSVQSIRHLYYLASILAISPFFDFKKNKCCTSLIHVIYSTMFCFLEVGLMFLDLIGRINNSYAEMNVPTMFMDVLALILQTVTILYLTIKLTLYRKNKFQTFVENLIDFDNKCSTPLEERPDWSFYVKILLYHVIFVLFCLSDAYMWNRRLGFRVLRFYISRYVQYYKIVTFAFLFYNYVRIIGDRFVHLNELLLCSVTLTNRPCSINECTQKDVKNAEDTSIKRINCLYTQMCDTMNLFNELFGGVLLFMCITIIIGLLQPINIAFSYAKTDLTSQRKTMDPDLIVVCVLWAILFLVRIIFNNH